MIGMKLNRLEAVPRGARVTPSNLRQAMTFLVAPAECGSYSTFGWIWNISAQP